jgi:post-segregation antitoxin (ccd killing protein)
MKSSDPRARHSSGRIRKEKLEVQVAGLRREAWLAENREALASSNAFVRANGPPLTALRQF